MVYVWRMRDGTPIRLDKMDDSHIANAKAMLERGLPKWKQRELDVPEDWVATGRRVDWYERWIERFSNELNARGGSNV